jgi:hypothetical protein
MRLRASLLIVLFLLAIGTVDFNTDAAGSVPATLQSDNQPRIFSARVKGKKLILTGENFAMGAVVLINGEPHKTQNDPESPSTVVIAKKAGKFIPDDSAVSIQVQSANSLTEKFPFFKGRVITLDDASTPIRLRVGERFLLFLLHDAYEFTPSVLDQNVLRKVADVEFPGSQGVFEALSLGSTKLSAVGLLPCHKQAGPIACQAPILSVEFTIVVE